MPQTGSHYHTEYALKREVNELYVSVAIKKFGVALIGIFEPIYLYIFFNESVAWTLLYYIAIYLGQGLLVMFGAKLIAKIGVKHSILLSVPFLILYFGGLYALELALWIIYLLPIVSIIYKLIFWPAFHLDFSRFSEKKNRGKQVSVLRMLNLGTHIIGPLVGGIIIVKFGFPLLFGIVVVILFLSAFPLFLSKEVYAPFHFKIKDLLRALKGKRHRRPMVAMAAWGVEEVLNTFIWPIYMFIVIADYAIVGGIYSGVSVLAIIFAYIIGRIADRVSKRKLLRIGSVITAAAWLLRGFTKSGGQIAIVDTIYKFSGVSAGIPLQAKIYDWENQAGPHPFFYIILREITISTGRVVILSLACLLLFSTGSFISIFIIAALMSLLLFLF